jgi:hypothetical protein
MRFQSIALCKAVIYSIRLTSVVFCPSWNPNPRRFSTPSGTLPTRRAPPNYGATEAAPPLHTETLVTMERPVNRLYHGTLVQNIPSIREQGVLPQNDLWTAEFYSSAPRHVYACRLGAKRTANSRYSQEHGTNALVQWSEDGTFDEFKDDLWIHGAVIVLRTTPFHCCHAPCKTSAPAGRRAGDWYSCDSVGIENIEGEIIG